MSEIADLVLSSGIIPQKVIDQLRKWGVLDPQISEKAADPDITQAECLQLLYAATEMYDAKLRLIKETKLDVTLSDPQLYVIAGRHVVPAYKDEWDNVVVSPADEHTLKRGAVLRSITGERLLVIDYEDLYSGDEVVALVLDTEELPNA